MRPNRKSAVGKSRLGFKGYAELLAALRSPMGMQEVRQQFGGEETHTKRILNRLRDLQVTHICGWRKGASGFGSPVYVLGQGVEPPHPGNPFSNPRNPHSFSNRLESLTQFIRIYRRLAGEPISMRELAVEVGSAYRAVREVVHKLHELQMVRIAEWEPRSHKGGAPTALYQTGSKRDAVRPGKLDPAIRNRIRRESRNGRAAQLQIIRAIAGVANDSHIKEAA